jgi:hypothetical protein
LSNNHGRVRENTDQIDQFHFRLLYQLFYVIFEETTATSWCCVFLFQTSSSPTLVILLWI